MTHDRNRDINVTGEQEADVGQEGRRMRGEESESYGTGSGEKCRDLGRKLASLNRAVEEGDLHIL